tara:strand:+ start:1649 stop:2596 length:948 start_codon:yes stop_codon:yes gene_type:complete
MQKLAGKKLVLADPRGFCAGVQRAIDIVDKAIELFGNPIYVKHEVVHNKFVIEKLKDKGVIFIEDIGSVPENSIIIFSAHGVSSKVKEESKKRNLKIFDATCPLVTKVHLEVHKYASENKDVILIGHRGHPEIEGTMGQFNSESGKIHLIEDEDSVEKIDITNKDVAYVTQTTLSVDDTRSIIDKIKIKFPNIVSPAKDDICYATQNRQDAVKSILKSCDCLIVVGSVNSSNSKRLTELAGKQNIVAYLVDNKNDINIDHISKQNIIGITAGASAPEILIDEIIEYLESHGASVTENNTTIIEEDITFSLPKELR